MSETSLDADILRVKRYLRAGLASKGDIIAVLNRVLKERMPVKAVYSRQFEKDPDIEIYACGACGKELSLWGFANYCQHCGKKVKWDD